MYDMDFQLIIAGRHGMPRISELHREDIKSVIRKRYGSLAKFEKVKGLARQSVTEVLRGRPSKKTRTAIERVLREEERRGESIIPVGSSAVAVSHRLNAEAR